MLRSLGALLLAAGLLVAGCGNSEDGQDAGPNQEGSTDVTAGDTGVQVEGALDAKPTINLPGGEPPAELVSTDIAEGEGEAVPAGATVTTHYVGVSWSTGQEFDSSWDRGQPAEFPLSRVIAGWTEGIPGMKIGGRRLLVIPSELAYGQTPPPGAGIAPGETLVFVIDMVSVA